MAEKDPNRFEMRDYPVLLWVFGVFFVVVGIFAMFSSGGLVPGLISFAIGAAVALLLPTIVIVTSMRGQGGVTVTRWSLLSRAAQNVALRDIAAVDIQQSVGNRGGSVYRMVLSLQTGEYVPLQGAYSGGYPGKAKKALALAEFLGVPGPSGQPASPWGLFPAPSAFTLQQDGVTRGITWRLETGTVGAARLSRWVSADSKYPNQFLWLMQKAKGSADIFSTSAAGGGLVYRRLLELYGFRLEDAPGLEKAGAVEGLDPQLGMHFAALASDPAAAREKLNPWVVTPLVDWASRHPASAAEGGAGQLAVLLCPRGVYVVSPNLTTVEQNQALTHLGVEISRAVK
jgi:hypothetical protein